MKKAVAIPCMLLCIASSGASLADPGPTVTYLMNEPVTMLSFGLLQMQTEMDRAFGSDGVLSGAAYNWDTNRIVLSITRLWTPPEHTTKDECRSWILRVREQFGVAPETGKPYPDPSPSMIGGYFTPGGFVRKDEPKDLGSQLDQIVEISVVITSKSTPSVTIGCQGPLLGTEVLFRE